MKPTVSVTRNCFPSCSNARVVGSSVSKRRSSTDAPAPVKVFRRVDLPTFVYPASAIVGMLVLRRSFRRVARWPLSARRRRFTRETRVRARRRSLSSWLSPGPRVPTPPPRRSRCCHIPRMRGRLYSSFERVLQRSLLRRAQLIVDEKYLRRRVGISLLELRELPLPDERPRIRMSAMLHDLGDGRNTCSARELPQLGQLCLIVAALGKDADDETALRLRPWSGIGLASGHGGIMPR